jgi:DNA uptake protein ComE-like DNA-binding protein
MQRQMNKPLFVSAAAISTGRGGLVLIVVTILLALMSLAALGFIALMQNEHRASQMRGNELILENAALSASEFLAVVARQSRQQRVVTMAGGENGNPCRHQSLSDSEGDPKRAFFAILPTSWEPKNSSELVFGFTNESSKLHLQTVLDWDKKIPGSGQRALMQLPGMSADVADKILDWIDEDSLPRAMGAETDKYISQRSANLPRNKVPRALDELLLIPGVTQSDLFGDAESSQRSRGRRKPTVDSRASNSIQHPPWSHYLTVHGRERNETFEGEKRIFLNTADLVELHRQLASSLGVNWANFVVAYRQFGPARTSRGVTTVALEPDFTIQPKFQFNSELELIGSKVAVIKPARPPMLLTSPLLANRVGWAGELSRVMDRVSIDLRPEFRGRVNIELADREVLLAIPEMDPATADQIIFHRGFASIGSAQHIHPTWLLEQGIVDLNRMKSLLAHVTTGGDVFSAEVVAYFVDRPMLVYNEIAVDGVAPGHSQLYCRDLRDRELSFPIQMLYAKGTDDESPSNESE